MGSTREPPLIEGLQVKNAFKSKQRLLEMLVGLAASTVADIPLTVVKTSAVDEKENHSYTISSILRFPLSKRNTMSITPLSDGDGGRALFQNEKVAFPSSKPNLVAALALLKSWVRSPAFAPLIVESLLRDPNNTVEEKAPSAKKVAAIMRQVQDGKVRLQLTCEIDTYAEARDEEKIRLYCSVRMHVFAIYAYFLLFGFADVLAC